MKKQSERIDLLTDQLHHGSLSDEERKELNALLKDDPDARRQYLQSARLESGLRDHYSGGSSVFLSQDEPRSNSSFTTRHAIAWAAAACLLISLGSLVYLSHKHETPLPPGSPISMPSAAWAWLEYRDNMEIEAAQDHSRQIGLPLYEQKLRINDGQASIRFRSGTQLALIGPAELFITGPNAAKLIEGSATVRIVDGSEGFELETPSGTITDLGTAFGVHVDPAGHDEIHVLDGKVRVETAQGQNLRDLVAGQADYVHGSTASTIFRPESFPAITIDKQSKRMVKTTWLDELDTRYVQQEWGKTGVNESVERSPLSVAGVSYRRGLGTHASFRALYRLPEGALRFRALVGIDDEVDISPRVGMPPSCMFRIIGDGKELWRSPVMRSKMPAERIDLDIRGVSELRLLVDNAGDGNDWDHANWLEASIVHTGAAPEPKIWTNDYSAYILTPPESPTPRINGAKVVGGTPGKDFLFRIPTSGERPISFSADNLPENLKLDSAKGIIRGKVPAKGEYLISLAAKNTHGSCRATLKLVSGDKLALTPPMGWNSWKCWSESISQAKVLAAAKAIETSGLADYGWTYVNIDDCWQGQRGGPHGAIQGNARFPDMQSLCEDIHAMGLKVGIFSSPWMGTPAGFIGGSSDHPSGTSANLHIPAKDRIQAHQIYGRWPSVEKLELDRVGRHWFNDKDVRQWSDWGIDYAKYTWGHGSSKARRKISEEIRSSDRDMILSVVEGTALDDANKVVHEANLWRVANNIRDEWPDIWRKATAQQAWLPYTGPGHWVHFDILQLGAFGVPNEYVRTLRPTRLSPHEQYSHMSLWCLLSSPLMLSCDIDNLDPFTLSLLKNHEVIAINQDPLGKAATPVDQQQTLWLKPLEDGTYALGIFSPESEQRQITVNWSQFGLPDGVWTVRDLWRQKDLGQYPSTFTSTLAARGVTLVKLIPHLHETPPN